MGKYLYEIHYSSKENHKFTEFILNNLEEIIREVNEAFEKDKANFKKILINWIKSVFEEKPIHYEWYDDGCPYDHSGDITPEGYVNIEQTIYDFLENEYTGQKEATYTSGMGFSYLTYGDEISTLTLDYATELMYKVLSEYVKEKGNFELTNKLLDDIRDDIFDPIYENTRTYEFFCWEPAIEFAEIGDYMICDILDEKQKLMCISSFLQVNKEIKTPKRVRKE